MSRPAISALPMAALLAAALAAPAPARAANRLEKNLRLDPGGAFSLKTDAGWVKITGTDRPGAHVVVTAKNDDLDELLSFRFEEGAGSASVYARRKHPISSMFGGWRHEVGFEVEVPAKTRVTVDTSGGSIVVRALASEANLETSGGAIEVHDHTADVVAHTSGGSISLSHVRGKCRVSTSGGGIRANDIEGSLDGETSGGSISAEDVHGDMKVHTSGGGITIRNAGGRVEADTSGGSIQAEFARGNGRGGRLESSGGGVSVAVDPSVGLSIDASGNSVRSDVPVTIRGDISRSHIRGNLNSGGETLRVHTSGGSVSIRSL